MIEWLADLDVTRYILRRTPPALHEEDDFLKRMAEDRTEVFWAIEVDGTLVGTTGIHGIDWINAHATTGIMVGDKSYWRRGVATEAMRLRTRFAFHELNLHKLRTFVLADNAASRRALEKAGYRHAGTLREEHWSDGGWHDTWIGEVLREEWEREQR
jgi:RimJ/RimL family protein N-acetyltransferase